MCDLAIAGLATSIAGTLFGGYSQYQQAQAQAAAAQASAEYNSQVAANEAQTQRNMASAEIQKGIDDRNRVIRAGLAKQGEMAAGMAASGFTLDSGTNLSLLGQSAEEIQHDASIAAQNANMAAWRHEVGATRSDNDGSFAKLQGQLAKNSDSKLGIAGTLLGGIGQGLTGYYQIKNTATPPKVGG